MIGNSESPGTVQQTVSDVGFQFFGISVGGSVFFDPVGPEVSLAHLLCSA